MFFSLSILYLCTGFFVAQRYDSNAGYGVNTIPVVKSWAGNTIQCISVETIEDCIGRVNRESSGVLVFGNSMLHGINAYLPGQKQFGYHLQEFLPNVPITVISLPNMSPQEMALVATWVASNTVVVSINFDDFRGGEIRAELSERPKQHSNEVLRSSWRTIKLPPYSISLEDFRSSTIYLLYKLRNSLFLISNKTRRIASDRDIDDGIARLSEIVRLAPRTILVIAPLPDGSTAYDTQQYNLFKSKLRVKFGDRLSEMCEHVVGTEDFGLTAAINFFDSSDVDFNHFTERGHINYAACIAKQIELYGNL